MRIVAGEYKGRRLEMPADLSVRPTTGKVKEALFSMMADRIWDCRFLDLFAGTGGIGLEALSRGARECVFSDSSRESIKLIKENISKCGAQERSRVYAGDYTRTLAMQKDCFDIIFLDPPYGKGMLSGCFEMICEHDLLADDGVIIAEHRRDEPMPEELCGFVREKEKKYGTVILSIYGRNNNI